MDATVLGYLVGGVVLIGVFVVVEANQREPMLDLSLFTIPTLAAPTPMPTPLGARCLRPSARGLSSRGLRCFANERIGDPSGQGDGFGTTAEPVGPAVVVEPLLDVLVGGTGQQVAASEVERRGCLGGR